MYLPFDLPTDLELVRDALVVLSISLVLTGLVAKLERLLVAHPRRSKHAERASKSVAASGFLERRDAQENDQWDGLWHFGRS